MLWNRFLQPRDQSDQYIVPIPEIIDTAAVCILVSKGHIQKICNRPVACISFHSQCFESEQIWFDIISKLVNNSLFPN